MMSAEIFTPYDFLWKLVARDIDKFFAGDLDMETANIGRALGFSLPDQIQPIRDCWAEARRMRAAEQQQQREGA